MLPFSKLRFVAKALVNAREIARVKRIFRENTFVNPDIGPLNDALNVDYFILSSPKCGTTALQRGFERLGHKVIHAHTNISTWNAFSNGEILRNESIGMEVILRSRLASSSRPVHVFFGYREPVSWYLSLAAYLQINLDAALADNIAQNIYSSQPWSNYNLDDLVKIFREAAGIDILSYGFDHDRGYSLIKKDNFTLISYRYDRIEAIQAYIVNNLDKDFVLTNERVNEDQAYYAYKTGFKVPPHSLEHIYCDKWFQHFYTPAEREGLFQTYVYPGPYAPLATPAPSEPDLRTHPSA